MERGAGIVYFAEHKGMLILKMVGPMRISSGTGLDRFADYLKSQKYDSILIDMTLTTYIDSTHLGLLVAIASRFRNAGGRGAACIVASPAIMDCLKLLHLDHVFTILESSVLSPDKMEEVVPDERSDSETLRLVLNAHKNLARLDERNEPAFRNVIDVCEQQLGLDTLAPI